MLAVQTNNINAAREFADAEPRMPEPLVDVAMRIVVPVTALPGPQASEPCQDALETLGRVETLRQTAPSRPSTVARNGPPPDARPFKAPPG
ncbi:hypothetical protein [Streptomyces sp. CB01580]|uniref:hypothetical protein n=1 Tax=Streptomyces sp. CB01580 TaxID=1703933 RepID=UPI000938C6F5|nr:hypothetical protein [Streptomyces sp. CB01580]OKJ26497.1 hypothetical protein AMK22_31650 [Streptomyces sp. CB01580]